MIFHFIQPSVLSIRPASEMYAEYYFALFDTSSVSSKIYPGGAVVFLYYTLSYSKK